MQRSKKRKLRRAQAAAIAGAPLASTLLVLAPAAYGQAITQLQEITVTAQKRAESLQEVPLSIQALGTTRLEELRVGNFADYAKLMPSLSYQSGGQSGGPGFTRAYMRGVASGGDGNHSGSQPSVGTYLDEQPVTTINGALDVHLYDIERVEVLAGPQGTFYGASSQAGTIRIITNKPDPRGFEAGYDLEVNTISKGGAGYLAEGFVNVPLSERAAIRLVGWARYDAGFIDNVPGSVTYPEYPADPETGWVQGRDAITRTNADRVEKDYNDGDVYGARAALKVDLDDNWSVTVGAMGQRQTYNGSYGYRVGEELEIVRFNPESTKDRWVQAALTVEGKLGNFDVVYAGSYLDRSDDVRADYVDYSVYYDVYSYYVYNDAGEYIDPTQYIVGKDGYTKQSHELRISSPADARARFVAGLFYQRQEHEIEQNYKIDNIATELEVTGWPDTWWLTEQLRVDRDYAIFGEATFDLTEKLSATAGVRFFRAKNSLEGFFGFGLTHPYTTGEKLCYPPYTDEPLGPSPSINGGPCTNLNKEVKEDDYTPKLSLMYEFDDRRRVYLTYSEGFRPGGVNRRGTLPPYDADFLTNFELGWKTAWADGRVRFNGAVFQEDWDDFQFSFLGENSLTQIANAGSAQIKGIEADLFWAPTDRLTLAAGIALLDAELTSHYCAKLDPDTGASFHTDPCPNFPDPDDPDDPEFVPPEARKGTQLPVTPKFKGNLTARYTFPLGAFDAHLQGAMVYVGSRWPELRAAQREILDRESDYTLVDLGFGLAKGGYTAELFVNNVFDERAQLDRWAQCDATVCGGGGTYITPAIPRTIGLRFGRKF